MYFRSSQSRQPPDAFGTISKGDAHGLFERHMMPIFSILWNSLLAIRNLCGGSQRVRECGGGPVV
ncbi:hypothetical protein T10_10177 [Trichinella papuae]|uniref:Uncharacterized protein n=1 Tax=Trichinella papuae TaxID=268474 RepID=A0A0V1M8J6_9BILA|nr:hypothetical protein T10_10177 [Trichinella papuae]